MSIDSCCLCCWTQRAFSLCRSTALVSQNRLRSKLIVCVVMLLTKYCEPEICLNAERTRWFKTCEFFSWVWVNSLGTPGIKTNPLDGPRWLVWYCNTHEFTSDAFGLWPIETSNIFKHVMLDLGVKTLYRDMGMSENGVYPQWNSHLVGIMISKTIGFRGTLFSDKPILCRCGRSQVLPIPFVGPWWLTRRAANSSN